MKKTKGKYNYRESGIDEVILHGITIYVCKSGHKVPAILHIEELHEMIAIDVVKQKRTLVGQEIKFLRKAMGLKAVDLAKLLAVTKVTVSRWEANTGAKIGPANDRLLRLLYLDKKGLLKKIAHNIESMLEAMPVQVEPEVTTPINISEKRMAEYRACAN